jgi:S-adenosylmethionine:tRNA ribosyltransferase-isomerase
MKAATQPIQRPAQAKLLHISKQGCLTHAARQDLAQFIRPGDLLIANDAATLPASLHGVHARTGQAIEVRLAGRTTLAVQAVQAFVAVLFGAGDHRVRTEDRVPPPLVQAGDVLTLGPLIAQVRAVLGHPRLVQLHFAGSAAHIWRGLFAHGKPVQYAHLHTPLQLWDVWTRIAALPVAFEAPSAGFALDWALLAALRAKGVGFATLTHAAGISSTGDTVLDARLPLPEPYLIPEPTVAAIAAAQARGGRIIALGTTVVRALEHSAGLHGTVQAGEAVATQRIGPQTRLQVVDALLSGTHEPGTSHYELLQAFAYEATLTRASQEMDALGYLTHEFGDSVLLERAAMTKID